MVSSGFYQNIRRDYDPDTTSSEDENSPSQDIVSITPPARTVREGTTHSVDIVNLRKLFTDLARYHPTLVSELKVNGFDEYFITSRFFDDWYVEKMWFTNVGTRKRKRKTLHITFRKHSNEHMVSSGFYQNIRRDYESDTTTSEDENSPRHDIHAITPAARIVNLRKLFTDLARHHPTLASELKIKIVLNVLVNDPKSRSRSMTIAVGVPGVTSVEQDGEARHLLLVTGAGIDATHVTRLLRKKIGSFATGFTSVEVDGEVRGLFLVTGAGIDATHITTLLRKKNDYTELQNVTPQLNEKEDKKTKDVRGWPWLRALRRRLFFQR